MPFLNKFGAFKVYCGEKSGLNFSLDLYVFEQFLSILEASKLIY
jgi:hypothetical protein